MVNTVGITETEKMLSAMGSGLIGLKDIDYHQVAKEVADLDGAEKKKLILDLADVLLKFVGYAQEYKTLIRLLLTFV